MQVPLFILIFVFYLNCPGQSQGDLIGTSLQDLDKIATEAYSNNDFEMAMKYWQKLLPLTKEQKQDSLYVCTLGNIGIIYEESGDLENAENFYTEAYQLSQTIFGKKHILYINSVSNLAFLEHAKDNYKTAEAYYKEVLEILDQTNNQALLGEGYNNIATLYHDMGKLEEAEVAYLAALKIMKKQLGEESIDYATAISNYAGFCDYIGQPEQGLALEKKALAIRRKLLKNPHSDIALSLGNIAAKYARVGKLAEAEPLMLEALAIQKEILGTHSPLYLNSLSNMAELYNKKEEFVNAQKTSLSILEILEKTSGKQHIAYAHALGALAFSYRGSKEHEKARSTLKEANLILKKIVGENHTLYAKNLSTIAVSYIDIKQYDEALHYLDAAATIYKEQLGTEHVEYIGILIHYCTAFIGQNDFDKAINVLNQTIYHNCKYKENSFENSCPSNNICLELLDKSNMDFYYPKKMVVCLDRIYYLKQKQYELSKQATDLEIANIAIKKATEINQTIRNNYDHEANKLRTLEDMSSLAFKGIFNNYKLATLSRDDNKIKDYWAQAFSYAEQNKSILLSDAIKGSRAKVLGDLPDSLALQEHLLEERKSDLLKKIALAKTTGERKTITAYQNKLNEEIDAFAKGIKEKHPRYHALKYENITASIRDVQALLDGKTAFVEYFVDQQMLFVFVITKNSMDLIPIKIDIATLKNQIKTLRLALSNYKMIIKNKDKAYNLYIEAAHWFYNNLLKDAIEGKPIDNLVIIADGELGHLPFEAFLVSPAKAQNVDYSKLDYLLHHYNISYNYSATLWKAQLHENKAQLHENKNNKQTTTASNNSNMLAIASNYSNLEKNIKYLRSENDCLLRDQLIPLPAAQKEVVALSTQFNGLFLQGMDASEANFKSIAPDYGIIHLAMHGLLNASTPMLSSLAFTEDSNPQEDNFLQAYEIAHLNLNANLVVLSACETGYGQFEQGEGVISLARSFMYAGVPSLVVSLWQVNDASTSTIMQSFYQHLAAGKNKDVALKEAKLDYLHDAKGIMAHPAFWSPFIQLGDNRPIKISIKRSYLFYAGIGGLVLLILALLVWFKKRKA